MGACSSKEKKSKTDASSNGSANKAKYKAAKKGKKGQEKWKNGEHIEDLSMRPMGSRKDSDVEDLKVPPVRERSKSLRFGDFAQMDRIRKVDDNELLPIDIAFFQDGKVEPEELCHVCSVYTGSESLVCGVCYRMFHESCLAKIGQWSSTPEAGTQPVMWTCHQCANLGNLLTEEEVITVLKRLDKCGIRREDDLSLADYMAYCHVSLQEDEGKILTRDKADNARRRFQQVDASKRGRIAWCQFLNIETIRFLKKRSKNALVRLLTSPELERARDGFRLLDTDMDGRITKAAAHDALDRNSRRSGYYPDETMMYIDDDLNQSISWTDFLRDRAIYIIAERPSLRASPLDVSTRRRGSARSINHVTSLPIDPDVIKNPSSLASQLRGGMTPKQQRSGSSTPVARTPSGSGQNSARSSAGNQGSRSGSTTPVTKSSQGFPQLPPPSYCGSRASSSSQRRATSVPSTPEKKFPPDLFPPPQGGGTGTAQQDSRPGGRVSTHSGQGSNCSLGCPSGCRHSSSSESSWTTALSGSDPTSPLRKEARSSQADFITNPANVVAGKGDATGGGLGPVTGKPPIGNGADGRYGRAVVAPPYGKLVAERLHSGEWRKTQARSLVIPTDAAILQPPLAPSFGHVTGDVNTGRRPLSLV